MPVRKSAAVKKPTVTDIIGKPEVANTEPPKVEEVVMPVITAIPQARPIMEPSVQTQEVLGILDIQPEGHGFLRPKFIPSSRDVYISQSQIRRFLLRPGDLVEGIGRPPKDTERYFGLLKVEKVNGVAADDSLKRPYFDDLTPIYPRHQVILSTGKLPYMISPFVRTFYIRSPYGTDDSNRPAAVHSGSRPGQDQGRGQKVETGQ